MKPWILLIVAGLLETGWAVGLKYTEAFTRFWPSVGTAVALVASMLLLAIAVRELPVGTAYPVWVGIGAVGAAMYGMLFLGESTSPARIVFLTLLIIAIIGLKVTAARPAPVHRESVHRESAHRESAPDNFTTGWDHGGDESL